MNTPTLPIGFQMHLDPGTFSGSTESESAQAYIDRFEKIASTCGWTSQQKLLVIPICLRESSLAWLNVWESNNAAQRRTWDTFKRAFLKEFLSADHQDVIEYKLRMRQQAASESAQAYVYDVLNLCNEVNENMSELEQIKHLMRGLRSDIKEKMTLQNPITRDEFMTKLELIQKSLNCTKGFGHSSNVLYSQVNELQNQSEIEMLRTKVALLTLQLKLQTENTNSTSHQ